MGPDAVAASTHPETPAIEPLTINPVSSVGRIDLLDVLRGVAVLGILMMNIPGFAIAWKGVADPMENLGPSIIDTITSGASDVLFEGTMRGLFSMLFGAGIVLLTSRIEARDSTKRARTIHYRRNAWLIVFGLIHAYLLLWTGDILYIYGVTALLLYPLRRLRPRTLIILGALVLAALLVPRALQHRDTLRRHAQFQEAERLITTGQTPLEDLPEDLQDAHESWISERDGDPEQTALEIEATRSDYLTILRWVAPQNYFNQTTELVKWTLWDAGGTMLIGMGLMKLGVLSGLRPRRVYIKMILIGYAVGLTVNIAEFSVFVVSELRNDPLLEWWGYYTYDVARLSMTLGHIGTIVLLAQSGVAPAMVRSLAAAGRMALTNYIGQTVICSLLFYGIGFGLYNRLSFSQLMLVMIGIWIVQVMFSVAWLRRFRFGPLEWLWRSLTYWKRQPMAIDD